MKQSRLSWLLGLLGLVALWRFLVPSPEVSKSPAVAQAIVRQSRSNADSAAVFPGDRRETETVAMAGSPEVRTTLESRVVGDIPGNAFNVRPPPLPPPAPPTPKPVAVKPPPPPPPVVAPPPPVPYEAIGTWDDGKAKGVFLASAYGTLLALPGTLLPEDYKVTEITPGQIALQHLPSKREVRLNIPVASNATRY